MTTLGALMILSSSACRSEVPLGGFQEETDAKAPPFEPDAGEPDANSFAPLCKATTCPAPYATCSDDSFRCESNLDIDNANCGACGVVCPQGELIKRAFGAEWFCQSGKCELSCDAENHFADCNKEVGDGCEADLRCDPKNCGGCGVTCPSGVLCIEGNCGCPAGLTACGEACLAQCVHLASNDWSCGECGIACPFPEDPSTVPPNSYVGCGDSKCETAKCFEGFADCNGDFEGDGCEIELSSDPQNCGACGKACAPGQFCQDKICRCAPQETNCALIDGTPFCVNLETDPQNCGVCSHLCPQPPFDTGKEICRYGRCALECPSGYADCDDRVDNGCETFIAADPRNCGGCGVQCDQALGQPCVDGACLLRPCDPGEAR